MRTKPDLVENPLVSFTRQCKELEAQACTAWEGWMRVIQSQYQGESALESAVGALDFDYFGSDIVLLSGALGGERIIDAVSAHVHWNQLISYDHNNYNEGNLLFPEHLEPSFWVKYFTDQNKPEDQHSEVESVWRALWEKNHLNGQSFIPSYAFGRDITLRTAMVAWNFEMEDPLNDIFALPITDNEAQDVFLAHCSTGLSHHSGMSSNDEAVLNRLFSHIDLKAPYKLSPYMQTLFSAPEDLPLGIVGMYMLLHGEFDQKEIAQLVQREPQLYQDYLGAMFERTLNIPLSGLANSETSVYGWLSACAQQFHSAEIVGPLMLKMLATHNPTGPTSSAHNLKKILSIVCATQSLDGCIAEENTSEILEHLIALYRDPRHTQIRLTDVNNWWGSTEGWGKMVQWFAPSVRQQVEEYMETFIEAEQVLLDAFKSSRGSSNTPQNNQSALLKLQTLRADGWSQPAQKRTLKL